MTSDPLLVQMNRLREMDALYKARVSVEPDADEREDEIVEETYGPAFDDLFDNPQPVTSQAGAIAALKFFIADPSRMLCGGSEMILQRVVDFLKSNNEAKP